MNKKVLVILTMLAFSLLLTPIALATPGAEKRNDKFEYFQLVCSGAGSGVSDRDWWTPPNVDISENKTYHVRGAGWITGDTVELTVGSDTYTMTTTPVSVTWTTTYDAEIIRYNNGTLKRVNIRLTDVVTVSEDDEEIGTLVLKLKSTIVPGRDPVYYGNVVGYGTGELEGIHISAIDLGLTSVPPPIYERVGTITGWPEL